MNSKQKFNTKAKKALQKLVLVFATSFGSYLTINWVLFIVCGLISNLAYRNTTMYVKVAICVICVFVGFYILLSEESEEVDQKDDDFKELDEGQEEQEQKEEEDKGQKEEEQEEKGLKGEDDKGQKKEEEKTKKTPEELRTERVSNYTMFVFMIVGMMFGYSAYLEKE